MAKSFLADKKTETPDIVNEEKLARQHSEEPIQVTNISSEDYTIAWDGLAYTVGAGDTVSLARYKAQNFAKHLARKICIERGQKLEEANIGAIVDEIFGVEKKEVVKPSPMTAVKKVVEDEDEEVIEVDDATADELKGRKKKK